MACPGRRGLFRLSRRANQRLGVVRIPISCRRPLASSAVPAQSASGIDMDADGEIGHEFLPKPQTLCRGERCLLGCRARKSESGHVLAGHAFALEHEVLAEGRCGRLISGLRSAVQRLPRGPERRDRRPDEARFRPVQPRHGATPLFVGDFAPDVRSGPRPKLCARPGAHRHEQEIADRGEFRPRRDDAAERELTLQRWRRGDVVFDVRECRCCSRP